MILGKLTAVLCTTTLVLALASCSGDEPGKGAPGATTESATPPPTLAEGQLEVVSRHGKVRSGAHLDETGFLATTDQFFTISQPGNSLAAYARSDATEQWRVTVPQSGAGACFDPLLATPDTVVVFNGAFCELLVAYDVATGAEVHRERIVAAWVDEAGIKHREPTGPDDAPAYAAVTGAVALGGRVWYSTQQEIGYLGEDNAPVWVLDSNALGLVDDDREQSHPSELGVRAEDGLLVAQVLVSDQRTDDFEAHYRWLGIAVSGDDQPQARIAWQVDETNPATLGVPELARRPDVLLRTDKPGVVAAMELTGQRVGLGLPDAETGKIAAVGVVPPGQRVSVTEAGSASRPEFAWADGTLYTSADVPDEYSTRWVDAWDLTTGEQQWHVKLPAPGSTEDYQVSSLQVAPDGAVYAVATEVFATANLYRLDPATGDVTGTWVLPKNMNASEFRVQVVDETVIVLATENSLDPVPSLMVLRAKA